MTAFNFFVISIGVVVIFLILKGVRMVPQAENWIIETFGKYSKTLKAGLNLINPLFSRVAYKVDMRERVLDLPAQSIITADNATASVDGVVFYKVMDPYKACYGIENLQFAIANLGITTLRSIMGRMTLDEAFSSREKINAELLTILDEATDSWGTKVTRVEIKDIKPPAELAKAMALQKQAEQEKRARILEAEAKKEAAEREAEGYKRARILEAEARRESAERDAEARERLAQAEANAIKVVAESLLSSKGDPVIYLLGQEYIKSLLKLGESANTKFFVLPPDIIQTVKSLLNKGEK
ncbi:MAG: paraslipin [Brevinematales bacterium]|nr:paraslipin [Brevinematales bacterium]